MKVWIWITVLFLYSCQSSSDPKEVIIPEIEEITEAVPETPYLVILGTIQDAGSPHIACKKSCCKKLFEHPDSKRQVVSLGLIDPINQSKYLFEATPDISTQTKKLKRLTKTEKELPDGIFLTHAHIGHYSGLMYLGKEATNAKNVPVYAMPRMKSFLETNGPWSQLVTNKNIQILGMEAEREIAFTNQVSVTPFLVPHRDEYSETVGYTIQGPSKKALFIPDIDKWNKWEKSIIDIISQVDYAFLDATFFHGEEINTRDISQIPHPFIIESMELFKSLSPEEKKKVYFIHFNHTNPLIDPESDAYQAVMENGFNVAKIHSTFPL